MGVPSFSELGESARDVFRSGYHYGKGLMKLNVKTKSTGAFELGSDLTLNVDASKITGFMETKYKTTDYGTFVEKWSTDGTLLLGYELDGNLMQGLGMQSHFTYNPETSCKGIKLGAKVSGDNINAACTISNDFNSAVSILGSMVVALKEFFVGYQGEYNTSTRKMTKNDIGVAFNYQDVGFHFRCTPIPHEYGLSLLYKVNSEWDAVVNGIIARRGGSQEWTLGAGAKYKFDTDAILRFKFNTDLQLGMSLQQQLNENVGLTLSFNLDCGNVTKGGHKVGLALKIEA